MAGSFLRVESVKAGGGQSVKGSISVAIIHAGWRLQPGNPHQCSVRKPHKLLVSKVKCGAVVVCFVAGILWGGNRHSLCLPREDSHKKSQKSALETLLGSPGCLLVGGAEPSAEEGGTEAVSSLRLPRSSVWDGASHGLASEAVPPTVQGLRLYLRWLQEKEQHVLIPYRPAWLESCLWTNDLSN